VDFLDAPVSGGPRGAEDGTLSIMVGGDAASLNRVRPVLEIFGKNIFHMGPLGSGSATKICNQVLTATTHAIVAEAMVLGTKLGLDPRALFEVLRVSSGQCRALDRAVPEAILPRDFSAVFTIEGIIKDLGCAIRTAQEHGWGLSCPRSRSDCTRKLEPWATAASIWLPSCCPWRNEPTWWSAAPSVHLSEEGQYLLPQATIQLARTSRTLQRGGQ